MKYGKLTVVIVISTMMIFSGCNKDTSGVESTESTIVNEKENSDESSLISERKHCVKYCFLKKCKCLIERLCIMEESWRREGSHEKN